MTKPSPNTRPPARRMQDYRARLRKAGLRPVQMWLPDTRAASFKAKCRAQARAIAAHDSGGEDTQRFLDAAYEWPEA